MAETKIEKILRDRGWSQGDLVRSIKAKSGFKIGRDRISKICTGRLTNYTVETARLISEALDVSIDDIVDIENVKKINRM
jgi:DNA-binding Xre family transcriptional regulator